MEPIEWIIIGGVVILVLLAAFAGWIRRKLFGGTSTRPNTLLSVGQSPTREPAPPSGTTFVAKLTDTNGNPLATYDVKFTILAGSDGNVTSQIDGDSTVSTDLQGVAKVKVKGTDDGSDQLKVEVGLSEHFVDYETLKNDPP